MNIVIILGAIVGLLAFVFLISKMSKAPEFGVYAFLCLSSITKSPMLPLVQDRLTAADFIMVMVILATIAKGKFSSSIPLAWRAIDSSVILLSILFIFSSIVSLFFNVEHWSRIVLFMLIYLYGYFIFRVIPRLLDSPQKVKRAVVAYAAGACIVTLVGMMVIGGIYQPEWAFEREIHRLCATFKFSGQISSYVGPSLFIFMYWILSKKTKMMFRIASVFLFLGAMMMLIYSGSRISFAISVVIIGYFGYLVIVGGREVSRTVGLVLITFVLIGGGGFVVKTWTDTMSSSKRYGNTNTLPHERAIRFFAQQTKEVRLGESKVSTFGGTRHSEMSKAMNELPTYWLTGMGSGMFTVLMQDNEVHNSYVGILIENGVFALLLLLIWWGGVFQYAFGAFRGARTYDQRLMVRMVIGACGALLLYQMSTNGLRQRPFWFVPALALCVCRLARAPKTALESSGKAQRGKTQTVEVKEV